MRESVVRLKNLFLMIVIVALVSTSLPLAWGQNDQIVLSIVVPAHLKHTLTSELIADFEAEHPGVRLNVVAASDENVFFPMAADGIENHLNGIREYANQGDVVFVNSYGALSVEATSADYFLDISPLVSADSSLDTSDFMPGTLESVSWDGGIWALPTVANVSLLLYNAIAFDNAGQNYPDETWTLGTLFDTARALTVYNAQGQVREPGIYAPYQIMPVLFRAMSNEDFFDGSVTPNVPRFNTPLLQELVAQWVVADQEGLSTDIYRTSPFGLPMRVDSSLMLLMRSFGGEGADADWRGALLPGGKSFVDVAGFAVNRSTAYPELAYALLKFLTVRPETTTSLYGSFPARRSRMGNDLATIFPPEKLPIAELALQNALPYSALRFNGYLLQALNQIHTGKDIPTALSEAERAATDALRMAAEYGAGHPMTVEAAGAYADLEPGEIELKFAMATYYDPVPNQELWDAFVRDYVDSEPEVGRIVLSLEQGTVEYYTDIADCFFQINNEVPTANLGRLLNLDPFMDTDPSFSESDFVAGILPQVQRDGKTWAYPLVIQPLAMWYHTDQFAASGLVAPENGWTIDEFVNDLYVLRDAYPATPFSSQTMGDSYLLMLMAAYGGLPIDFRTSPPTVSFTDPTNMEAIRRVLDLAKEGLISYERLIDFSDSSITTATGENPVYDELIDGFSFSFALSFGVYTPYRLVMYPSGVNYNAVAYEIGAAYISANTPHPEACYRWISTLGQHPELFLTMPARYSLIQDQRVLAAQGQQAVDFYGRYANVLQGFNTLVFPSELSIPRSPNIYLVQIWLDRAFDKYVLEDADLEQELTTAQQIAEAYLGCAANLSPYVPGATTEEDYQARKPYAQCAVSADPSLEPLFRDILNS
jgi:ABC-type glycerol-3-phosphate transport system substrate-binding protein